MACEFSSNENVFKILENLWETENFADVEFFVGEAPDVWRIPAHKMVLSECSPVFMRMFNGSLKDSSDSNSIEITDIQPEIFYKLLRFVYTNEIKIESVDEAILLFQTAHKYIITEAIRVFIKYLCYHVKADNVLKIFTCLDCYIEETEVQPLQGVCLLIIDKYADEVVTSNTFLHLRSDMLFDITARSTLKLSNEQILFDALLQWSHIECKRLHISTSLENKRRVLGPTLFNVRFGLIDSVSLTQGPLKSGLMKPEDYRQFSDVRRSLYEPAACRLKHWKNLMYETHEQPLENAIAFISNKNVILTGVFLTANNIPESDEYYFRLLQNNYIKVEQKLNKNVEMAKEPNILKLTLPIPVYIECNKKYILYSFLYSGVSINEATHHNVTVSGYGWEQIKVTWEECELPSGGVNSTTLNSGQLYFLEFILPLPKISSSTK